jgi:acetyl/propionyl-CoA carboxylase alpha subunit
VPTVFIPNRGEIVRRVARTARRLGFQVAVGYSDADAGDPFLTEVDRAVRLGRAPASESYLSIDRVVGAARETGADLVHPGYGFLAEDPAFAEALARARLRFVGPSPTVLAEVGSKSSCRDLAAGIGIPIVPGYSGDQHDAALTRAADQIGYPVLVKPAAGGGGKGIFVVSSASELSRTLAAARRAALGAFGDDELLLERYVPDVRHVEVQVLRDRQGTCLTLGDRDCSTQRRHQKLIEESPAPSLDAEVRRKLHRDANALAAHVAYENVGTVEFIVAPDGTYYFLELNPRLQVEHPVTELVYDADIVEQQFRIALGEPLSVASEPRGHAIEVRVCAENPYRDFVPSSGRIAHLRWPSDARVDAAFAEGSELSPYYDSLIGKVIAYGADRDAAVMALRSALRETSILGIDTNLPLLRALARHERFTRAEMTTSFLERELTRILPSPEAGTKALAAAAAEVAAASDEQRRVYLRDEKHAYLIDPGAGRWRRGSEAHEWSAGDDLAWTALSDGDVFVDDGDVVVHLSRTPLSGETQERAADTAGLAPMAGRVSSVALANGTPILRGARVLTLEAMKMEMPVLAGAAGTLRLHCREGEIVSSGQRLFDIETASDVSG